MFPFLARTAALAIAGRLLQRLLRHPRLAPVAQSRRGRLALLALSWGVRRHPHGNGAARLMRQAGRRA